MFDASWGFYFDSLTVVMLSCHALPPKKPEKFCFVAWPRSSSTHAGVPLKRPIAGVAMGLILEADGRFCVLTDILGSEDALGDMDFKVAGDAEGRHRLPDGHQGGQGRAIAVSESSWRATACRGWINAHAMDDEPLPLPEALTWSSPWAAAAPQGVNRMRNKRDQL